MGATRVDLPDNLTELLRRASGGDHVAANAAFNAIYPSLRRMAQRLMRGQRQSHTLDAEALVHEAYMRVRAAGGATWPSRAQYLATMSRAMRSHLIDHARARGAAKRGGGAQRQSLTGIFVKHEERMVDLLTLDEVLAKLARIHPEAACVLELTYFLGMSANEVKDAMGWALRTVERELEFARTWVRAEFER